MIHTIPVVEDTNLARAMREALDASVTIKDMRRLRHLSVSHQEIRDLTGLEYAAHLTELSLVNNKIRLVLISTRRIKIRFSILSALNSVNF